MQYVQIYAKLQTQRTITRKSGQLYDTLSRAVQAAPPGSTLRDTPEDRYEYIGNAVENTDDKYNLTIHQESNPEVSTGNLNRDKLQHSNEVNPIGFSALVCGSGFFNSERSTQTYV